MKHFLSLVVMAACATSFHGNSSFIVIKNNPTTNQIRLSINLNSYLPFVPLVGLLSSYVVSWVPRTSEHVSSHDVCCAAWLINDCRAALRCWLIAAVLALERNGRGGHLELPYARITQSGAASSQVQLSFWTLTEVTSFAEKSCNGCSLQY